jgi:hypothetical protein
MAENRKITEAAFTEFVRHKEDEKEAVRASTQHYVRAFKLRGGIDLPQGQGWNWAAAFFGTVWMFYRRMYKMAIVCWVVLMAIQALLHYVAPDGHLIRFIFSVAVFVLFGLFGDKLYFKHVQDELAKGVKRGGTNIWGAIGFTIVLSILSTFVTYKVNPHQFDSAKMAYGMWQMSQHSGSGMHMMGGGHDDMMSVFGGHH